MFDEEEYKRVFDSQLTQMRRGRLLGDSPDGGSVPPVIERLRRLGQLIVDNHRQSSQTANLGTMPYVYLNIVDNTQVNATVFAAEGKEFIGIYAGVILVLQDLFYRMLARQDTFLEVGTPCIEEETPENIPGVTNDFLDILTAYESGIISGFPVPKDPVRIKYADTLLLIAFSFLVNHEVAHLRNGHIQLKQQCGGLAFMMEANAEVSSGMTPLNNQTCEFDADSWAATQGAGAVVGNRDLDIFQAFPSGLEGGIQTWGVAIWCLFRLLGEGYPLFPTSNTVSRFYPPPACRLSYSMITFYMALNKNHGEKDAYLSSARLFDIVVEAELGIASITGNEIDTSRFAEIGDMLKLWQEHVMLLNKHWSEVVRPLLLPLTRASDLPP